MVDGLELRDALSGLKVLSHFTPRQLPQLAMSITTDTAPAGSTIYARGESGCDVYLLLEGGVSLRRSTHYGMFNLARVTPGQIFGETGFFDGKGRTSDAISEDDSQLLLFDAKTLMALATRDQQFGLALHWTLWKTLGEKLRQRIAQMTEFFPAGENPPAQRRPPPQASSRDFHVDLADKRKLLGEFKLSNMEINFLASLSRERKYGPWEQIFREGDEGDQMYLVLGGRVLISKQIPGAGEEALGILSRGEIFGEMALIDDLPRSADAKGHEEGALVLAIPRDVLSGILRVDRFSSIRLLKILCALVASRVHELDDKLIGWYIMAAGD